MRVALKGRPETELKQPETVVTLMVDANTGHYVGPVPKENDGETAADEEPFPTDEEFGEVAAPEPTEPDRSMTTPIDVAAVMAEPEPEVEFSMDDEAETPPSTEEDEE